MREDIPAPFARLALLIPAFEPDEQLLPLLRALATENFAALVVVDDGSSPGSAWLFAEASRLAGVRVLRHGCNQGKGCALKTGIRELVRSFPNLQGIVTADADGQHTPEDIYRVAEVLGRGSDRFVLGVRTVASAAGTPASGHPVAKTPLRSAFGNALTRSLFAVLYGAQVSDTQTGLRGFSRELLPDLLRIAGDRYEYEMAVLTHLCRQGSFPRQVPISTVYLEGNRHSHFRPVLDSLRIYGSLLRPLLHAGKLARLEAGTSRAQ